MKWIAGMVLVTALNAHAAQPIDCAAPGVFCENGLMVAFVLSGSSIAAVPGIATGIAESVNLARGERSSGALFVSTVVFGGLLLAISAMTFALQLSGPPTIHDPSVPMMLGSAASTAVIGVFDITLACLARFAPESAKPLAWVPSFSVTSTVRSGVTVTVASPVVSF